MPKFNGAALMRLMREVDLLVLSFHAFYEIVNRLIFPITRRSSFLLPNAVYLETGSFCQGRCRDCYVPLRDRASQLRLRGEMLGPLFRSLSRLPLDYVCLVGGEPLDSSIIDTNLQLIRDHPAIRFLLCTGAHGETDPTLMGELRQQTNLSLVFSFDGFEQTHDQIRGQRSYARVCEALGHYNRAGRQLCGASVTLRPENWEETTTFEFVRTLCSMGCNYFVFDLCYLSSGRGALSAEEYARAALRLMDLSQQLPAPFFLYPFGQLLGRRLKEKRRMRTLAVDYHGDVYTSRRGHPFGNIHHDDLMTILSDRALQEAYQSEGFALSPNRDRRDDLFLEAFSLLRRELG